jgi:hypothetical protein
VLGSRVKAVHETALLVDSVGGLAQAVNIVRFCALLIHGRHRFVTQHVTLESVLVKSL